ncbi:MAG: HAMP domain-containing sensor histidine kinase, partial [Candidatus Pacebacteria bacterium]|nr:HAMP domain-containing sensor histidine kinase [Candidatus Paceibacterota bacterium]
QHDLRTPLGIFSGYCDLLLSGSLGKLPKKSLEAVQKIKDLSQSELKEVNTFLDVTQFQLGKGILSLKPGVDIFLILKEAVSELGQKAESKGIYLKLQDSGKKIEISADREKLKAAIFNIIDNSIKYTPKGGIDIKLSENADTVKIIISDTGIGMTKEIINSLFDINSGRSELAKRTTSVGKGLGLYLSGQIITAHKGKVWAESEGEGKGSTFFVELPIK